jgi:hypothetical protein
VAEEPYQVFRWTTALGRQCAAMVPPGQDFPDELRQKFGALADANPVEEGENPQFHFTVRVTAK